MLSGTFSDVPSRRQPAPGVASLGQAAALASARVVQLVWPAQGMGEGVLDETNRLMAICHQTGEDLLSWVCGENAFSTCLAYPCPDPAALRDAPQRAYAGREAEWQRQEADIIAAGREGRIEAPAYITK